jgi:hypothetical protein
MSYVLRYIGLWYVLCVVGCSIQPAVVTQPHNPCVGDYHSYRTDPSGQKWYIDCINQRK